MDNNPFDDKEAMEKDALKEIQELTKALEAYDPAPAQASTPALTVDSMPAFVAKLSEKASTLVQNPVKKARVPGKFLVSLMKAALWPIKEFYQEALAGLFNRLVEVGDASSYLAHGLILVVRAGESFVSLRGMKDMGPDEYGQAFVLFHSDLSPRQLNDKYDAHCFFEEGEIDPHYPNWSDVVEADETPFDEMFKSAR